MTLLVGSTKGMCSLQDLAAVFYTSQIFRRHSVVQFKGMLHLLTVRNKISSTHRSCYFLQRVKDLSPLCVI